MSFTLYELHSALGFFKNLCESILRSEDTVELFISLYEQPLSVMYRQQLFVAELLQLHNLPDLQKEALEICKEIQGRIEAGISSMYFKMMCNRLIDETSTSDSIGDLRSLPIGCLLVIASS